LFVEIWDRIRFGDSAKLSANIKTAADGVSLMTQIKSAATGGSLSEQEAEKLRRAVLRNVEELFTAGVYTMQMEASVGMTPSLIPVQRRRLLGHLPELPSDGGSQQNQGNDELEEPGPDDVVS
jgi:hypothetical protein